jgi:hypothetical protein
MRPADWDRPGCWCVFPTGKPLQAASAETLSYQKDLARFRCSPRGVDDQVRREKVYLTSRFRGATVTGRVLTSTAAPKALAGDSASRSETTTKAGAVGKPSATARLSHSHDALPLCRGVGDLSCRPSQPGLRLRLQQQALYEFIRPPGPLSVLRTGARTSDGDLPRR